MQSSGLLPDTGPLDSQRAVPPPVHAWLVIYHERGAEVEPLHAGMRVVIGRAPPCDVVLADPSLSREHASFLLGAGGVLVADLGSRNGTFVCGERIEQRVVSAGEEVRMGAAIAVVHVVHGARDALGLMRHDSFVDAIDREIVRSRQFGRTFAVVMVRASRRNDRHPRHWWPALQALLRPCDIAALYGADIVELVLVESSCAQALAMGKRIVEMTKEGPGLRCGIAVFPETAGSGDALLEVCRDALQRARKMQPLHLAPADGASFWLPPGGDPSMMSESAPSRALRETALRLARSAVPLLLLGETGSGKEVLARFIHASGTRRERPMLSVNCGAIPANLIETTLFGHERGAFTGADQQHKGVFEAADGGSVLLDEVGELTASAQLALLRVLENKSITRLGSTKEIAVDVRVVAATHRDLESLVAEGRFREDLWYRLNGFILHVPPLRERPEDVLPLAQAFLREASEAEGVELAGIAPDAVEAITTYRWPGNVRELKNAIARAAIVAGGRLLTAADLPERVSAAVLEPPPGWPEVDDEGSADAFKTIMSRLEAHVLTQALRRGGWNQTETARQLGMPLRTLQHKIALHGIKRPRGLANDE